MGENESEKFILEPRKGGYRIKRLRPDREFDPPIWVDYGYVGGIFKTRSEATEFMRSRVREPV